MSLTSYRAAPPRAGRRDGLGSACFGPSLVKRVCVLCFALCGPGGDRLSRVLRHSTMGAGAFNGRVRDGIGFGAHRSGHQAGATQFFGTLAVQGSATAGVCSASLWFSRARPRDGLCCWSVCDRAGLHGDGSREAIKPIGRLVPVRSVHCCTCTPGLSTWSSSTALKGDLVSKGVSRLDAFSGYPVRT